VIQVVEARDRIEGDSETETTKYRNKIVVKFKRFNSPEISCVQYFARKYESTLDVNE
jgi:hypothetical protein